MKRKSLISLVLIIVLGITFFYFRYLYGWMEFRWNKDTPEKFLSHYKIKKDAYRKDSVEILKQLKGLLKHHNGFFYSKEYYDSTQLIVDTILYSSDFNKLAVFALTKNPTSRQLVPNEKADWYYDATCYLGIRQKDTLSLSWIGPGFGNFTEEEKLKDFLNDNYFRLFATTKDINGIYKYYNLNDIRFWNCPIWKEQADKKQREYEFEEMMKKHPENYR